MVPGYGSGYGLDGHRSAPAPRGGKQSFGVRKHTKIVDDLLDLPGEFPRVDKTNCLGFVSFDILRSDLGNNDVLNNTGQHVKSEHGGLPRSRLGPTHQVRGSVV